MKIVISLAGLALAFALSSAAFAQSSDTAYCTTLTDTYNKYVQNTGSRGGKQGIPADVAAAMSKCSTSDVTSAIPVLEKALKARKIDLPSHS